MPLPLIAAALTGLAGVTGNILNTNAVKQTNQQNINQSNEMYARQRADALSDWDRQNSYNSPSQQMQRFKEAGLNPNLVYGQMTNAPAVRSSDIKQPNLVAPKIETDSVGRALGTYFDLKQQDLTIKQQERAIQLADEQIRGKKLENDNLIDQSPWLLEQKMNSSRLTGQQVQNVMADIRNKDVINPLQQDAIRNQIQTMVQSRQWQNLTAPQQVAVSKATADLLSSKISGQDIQNKISKYEYDLQNNLGVNKNIFSDLLKIAISSLFK